MLLFGGCPGHCQMVSIIPGLYARYPPPIVITRNDDTGCPVSSAGGPQTPPRMPVVLLGGQRGPVREFSSESVSSVWILFIWMLSLRGPTGCQELSQVLRCGWDYVRQVHSGCSPSTEALAGHSAHPLLTWHRDMVVT